MLRKVCCKCGAVYYTNSFRHDRSNECSVCLGVMKSARKEFFDKLRSDEYNIQNDFFD